MADDSAHKPPNPGAASSSGTPPAPVTGDELRRVLAEQAAALEAQIQRACQPEPPLPPGSNTLGARKDARFMAICTAPSINRTPAGAGMVPVPYQTVQDLSNSVSTARTVRFNGSPAYLLDQTTQPKGTGDERGTGKGIRSKTVGGEVKPVSGCKTVRIEGKLVVREGDKCTMNGGNNPGLYAFISDNRNEVSAEVKAKTTRSLSAILEVMAHQDGITEIQKIQWADKFTSTAESPFKKFVVGPQVKAWNASAEEKRFLKTRNSLSIALLGPYGALGAIARFFGASEKVVSESNDLGAAIMGASAIAAIGPRMKSKAPRPTGDTAKATANSTGFKVRVANTLQANKLGVEQGNFSFAKTGPLPNDMASTFSGGKYSEFVLAEDTLLYRAGTKSQPLGQYFSIEKPGGIIQTRIDKAVLPRWPGGGESHIDTSFGVIIPAGTKVYAGKVANQGGFYSGGTQQIVVQRPWTIPGVKVITEEPIK